jgi:tRNA nucleotidyltransferase (CCA-adding enzyme)
MTDSIARTDTLMASLGLEVYRVGGSIRDQIMGRPAKDADYMVRGVTLKSLYAVLRENDLSFKPLRDRNGFDLGVRLAKGGVEITLPRKERSTGPLRTDFDIMLVPDLGIADDAIRRDFTFNALYLPLRPPGPVADPTACGLYDLQHKLVRTTHPDSFRDDPLRILRALRFVATLGYDLAEDTREQMVEHATAVDGLSADGNVSGTVLDEFNRILMGRDAVKALRIARDTGVLARVLPELAAMFGHDAGSRYHDLTTDEHTFKALETAIKVDAPLRVRWALLFHDAGKPATGWVGKDGRTHYYARKDVPFIDPETESVNVDHQEYSEILWREAAERLNVPKALREDVALLIREHMVPCSSKIKRARIARSRIWWGDEFLSDLYLHRMCDLSGKGKANKAHMANVAQAEIVRREMAEHGVPYRIKDLAVGGADAKAVGLQGRHIGDALKTLLDEVSIDPSVLKLSRDWQVERLGSLA